MITKPQKNNTTRVAITGGPGIGKSTILEILAHKGYKTVPEAARIVIETALAKDSDCLPWKNLQKFQNSVSNLQLKLEDAIEEGLVFSDRGIVDGDAYSRVDKIIVPKIISERGRNRYDFVFILAPLLNYHKDNIRVEDVEKAQLLQKEVKASYISFGYNPIDVPVLPPEERVDFILNKIKGEEK